MSDPSLWPISMRLHEVQRAARVLHLEADASHRTAIAEALDLDELTGFAAEVQVRPWLDGAEIEARWRANVIQTCGVSLEPFDSALSGEFVVRVVPPESPAAVESEAEISVDPEAEDPPDVLEGDEIDVGAYLIEHLALEVDPFPRKPGAQFEPLPEETPPSPFAALKALNRGGGDEG